MKKILLLVAFCCLTFAAYAQSSKKMTASAIFQIKSIQRIHTDIKTDAKVAAMSPTGDYILLTSGANQGLWCYNLSSKKTTLITQADGAGYNVQISKDGQEIVYQETTIDQNHLRRSNIIRTNIANKQTITIARGQRNASLMVNSDSKASIAIEDQLMVLTKDGKKTILAPQGTNESYIWPSISPDGTKICYYVCGNGCWVANIDGSNPQYIGHECRAAQWYDNQTIVAMEDKDDGHFITSSAIVAYTLDGRYQVLTKSNMIAMYPQTAKGLITFATLKGEIYLITLK